MRRYRIAVIPGDGIGPEVISATLPILEAVAEKRGDLGFEFVTLQAGDRAKEELGEALPKETVMGVEGCDACLFAAVGRTASEVILPLRQRLDLYANVRPAKVYPNIPTLAKRADLILVRENTEDLYRRIGFREHDWGVALRIITRRASERIARYAFELARREGRGRVTSVHKANVLDFTDDIFLEACRKVAGDYPEIEYEEMIVDTCAMRLVMNPEHFDVLVTTNMFGDILSDLAAGLVGGLGMTPSGNIGDSRAIFEPVHGSAPDIAGRGIANPIATILSARMMLEWLGEADAAREVERGVIRTLEKGASLTPDLGGSAKTWELADAIRRNILEQP
ncbi:MAG: isocitrate/isopropylmalate dehydrogenase family protein [Candidatus Bathyarchaeia archaeon]|nr:isocitrate/isopropylmalate dehydrogenase family protein [Candidatus Bathyarchaeota archaeon]